MLRFTIVLTITALHLIGMDVVSARRDPPLRQYNSDGDAQLACHQWRRLEGQFNVTIPDARLGGQAGTLSTSIRSCHADLDHPVVYGLRYSVVADAHYESALTDLHHKVLRRFPYPATSRETEQNR